MFVRLSKRIVRHCCKGEGSDENELYIFGVNQFLNMLLNILTALFIGILFGETLQIVLFMLAYIPLRSYAGGWHSRTPLRCYIFSVIMLIAVSVSMKNLSGAEWIYYFILAAAVLVVLILAPVEDRNKPLDEIEHKVYKRRTVIITAAADIGQLVCCRNILVCCIESYAYCRKSQKSLVNAQSMCTTSFSAFERKTRNDASSSLPSSSVTDLWTRP